MEDLLQQTYLRLFEKDFRALRDLRLMHEHSFTAYVKSVAASVTIDHMRKEHRHFEALDDSIPNPHSDSSEHSMLLRDVEKHLEGCAQGDARRDGRVFWLYYRNGLTSKAISAIPHLGLSQKGVESLLFRLVRCLRKAMAEGFMPLNSSSGRGD